MMSRQVYVDCEELNCNYNRVGTCIAIRVHMVFDPFGIGEQGLTCDTFENAELNYELPLDEDYIDWDDYDCHGDR